jgi:amino-acid N-acetyltransferase
MTAAREIAVSFAVPEDAGAVRRLLAECKLPNQDIDPHLEHFIVAKAGDGLAGVVGLEPLGDAALLRSLAVRSRDRRQGVGQSLCAKIVIHARLSGITRLYLLTTGTEGFFRRLGFEGVERSTVPAQIKATTEFGTLCPESATVMVKPL